MATSCAQASLSAPSSSSFVIASNENDLLQAVKKNDKSTILSLVTRVDLFASDLLSNIIKSDASLETISLLMLYFREAFKNSLEEHREIEKAFSEALDVKKYDVAKILLQYFPRFLHGPILSYNSLLHMAIIKGKDDIEFVKFLLSQEEIESSLALNLDERRN